MKSVRIAIIVHPGAADIYVETDIIVDVPDEEEKEGEELQDSNPIVEMPTSVKRIFDIRRVVKFESILDFTTWLHEEQAVVSRMVVL